MCYIDGKLLILIMKRLFSAFLGMTFYRLLTQVCVQCPFNLEPIVFPICYLCVHISSTSVRYFLMLLSATECPRDIIVNRVSVGMLCSATKVLFYFSFCSKCAHIMLVL